MNNSQVIKAFAACTPKNAKNTTSTLELKDGNLYSYGVPIVHWVDGSVAVNGATYSTTTSRHRNSAIRAVQHRVPVFVFDAKTMEELAQDPDRFQYMNGQIYCDSKPVGLELKEEL